MLREGNKLANAVLAPNSPEGIDDTNIIINHAGSAHAGGMVPLAGIEDTDMDSFHAGSAHACK